jgi:hypothetical protein
MDLKKRIEKITPYFFGMKMSVEDNIVFVQTKFPSNWTISEFLEESFGVQGVVDAKKNMQIFFTSIENGFDKVFDAIEYTIQMNLNALERLELFKKKVEELKSLFDSEDIERLKSLEFTFKKTKPKGKPRRSKTVLDSQYVASVDETLIVQGVCNNEKGVEICQ